MIVTAKPSAGLKGDAPAAASPQGVADRQALALIAVERTRMPMLVTDPRQLDNPIVLANKAFLDLSGYGAEEILGRNCRFLQGEGTSLLAVAEIRAGIAEHREVNVEILNYRKDGSAFWNLLHISPIHDDSGRLIYFFASQVDVSERRKLEVLEAAERRLLKEVDHRALNVLAVVQGIVRLTRADNAALYATSVERRVQALAKAHAILARRGWKDVPLAELIEMQIEPFGTQRVALEGPDILLSAHVAQPLALVFHELIANTATHGALSQPNGVLRVQWSEDPEQHRLTLAWDESGGPAPALERPSGFGSTIIGAIVGRQLRGRFDADWRTSGLRAQLTIPMRAA
ncbi:PAS domain-containing protein [Caulobacter sp. S45]|uniref:blue-light-activated histidine kinase n=1 Tax=Caulobacter sp. S45 TaxID=1641861 RepID=UPI00131DAB10|nr:PAS domain-containing protein [Caulobacter sp. S45]